jgi:hypothetical protein
MIYKSGEKSEELRMGKFREERRVGAEPKGGGGGARVLLHTNIR